MFDSSSYPKPLDEDLFETWLEEGRSKGMGYKFLIITWDVMDHQYKPVYIEDREVIQSYEPYEEATGHESVIAVYDLYSESRIML